MNRSDLFGVANLQSKVQSFNIYTTLANPAIGIRFNMLVESIMPLFRISGSN